MGREIRRVPPDWEHPRYTLEAFALALVATLAVAMLPLLCAVALGWGLAGLAWAVIGEGE